MTPREVIQKKRDRGELSPEEISFFIRGCTTGEIADYHIAAFLMAVYIQGMTINETLALTQAMRDSGRVLDLSSIPGKKVDKHSTGGVGDKTSMIVAPVAAACGIVVPMITGRALGHTGGTLDKLEAIPGFNAKPSAKRVFEILKTTGAFIIGQTEDLAPADRRLYSLRDVTATVESIPLITGSILSKKLAAGADGIVMDVKAGSGAFMRTTAMASDLARSLVDVCRKMKMQIVVLITSMEQPLGRAVGNSIEIRECIDFLKGAVPEDLETVSLALAAHMIRLGGRAKSFEQASRMAYEAVSGGRALEKFREMLRAQGADDKVIENPDMMPVARHVRECRARTNGYVTRCDALLLGLASNALGAGRNRVDDVIDPSVGLYLEQKLGDRVKKGDTLCRIHWNDEARLHAAIPLIEEAYEIKSRAPQSIPLIHAVLE
ncbi:MAG: thymidine phosphorylase [Acidobacteria bacterium]|nr:thymidine phosphorylase [Acidobacteriota bacterium]